MPKPKTSQEEVQVALRILPELLTAIDAEVEKQRAKRPGAKVSRSDVIREALYKAFVR